MAQRTVFDSLLEHIIDEITASQKVSHVILHDGYVLEVCTWSNEPVIEIAPFSAHTVSVKLNMKTTSIFFHLNKSISL